MNKRFGIFQLAVLMLTHFLADMLGGVLAGALPIIKEHFVLTLQFSVVMMATISISSNLFQIVIGNMRKKTDKPFFIYAGLVMLMLIGVIGLLPSVTPKFILILFAILFGFGVAAVHPEGVRGALGIASIDEATTTSAFMMMGFLGFSSGPLVGALLISGMGLKALSLLIIPLILAIVLIKLAHLTLATDKKTNKSNQIQKQIVSDKAWTFNQLFVIAVFLGVGATFLQALLPSYIYANGFSLTYGGFMAFLFGLGSSIGSLGCSILTKKYRPSNIVIYSISIGIPLLILSLYLLEYKLAIILVFLAGLFISSSLPLLVVLSKSAPAKFSLGVRVGIMVGGTWGIAAIILLLLSKPIEYFGLAKAMKVVIIFYVLALAFAYYTKKSDKNITQHRGV